jgi:hypothetical protein
MLCCPVSVEAFATGSRPEESYSPCLIVWLRNLKEEAKARFGL